MKKPLVIRLFTAVFALLAAWVAFTQTKQGGTPRDMQIVKLKDDLYVIRANATGNTGVYITDEGTILVDDKFDEDHQNLLAAVKSLTDKPIRYIMNTHQHGDHTGGNAQFLPSAEIIIQKNARANMVTLKQPGIPRISYSDEAEIFLGGKEVRAHYYGRGHTNGDAVMYFPALRMIHTGDLFVNGPYFIPNYPDGGSLKDWPHTLDEVLKLDFDVVIPGHGPMATRADVVKFRNRLEAMWNSIITQSRQGKSTAEISAMLKADFAEFGGSIAGPKVVEAVVAESKQ
jgi:cyclase